MTGSRYVSLVGICDLPKGSFSPSDENHYNPITIMRAYIRLLVTTKPKNCELDFSCLKKRLPCCQTSRQYFGQSYRHS
ncbi:hypothetical protein TNCV_1212501 [Trichonephila clavipes]|nr:hypothetical protein TNCV_1212501 [Trichonephila clavipes]